MKFLYYFSPFYRGKILATYYHENESPGLLMKAIMRMHIIFFLILITCLNVFSKEGTAQISLHIEKGDLETVFKAIERQTDYSFMYEVSLLKGSRVVSIDVKGAELKEVLDEVFRGQPFYYEVISKTIVVKEKGGRVAIPQDEKKTILIKGKVTDKQNTPLVGVSVRIKGANTGTLTDQTGNYTIIADPNGVIIFSYVGYQTFNIMINGQTEINMTMVENTSQLDETVVKGYYSTTKTLNTGNVSTVKGEDIAKQPVGDPIAGLIGRVPGLFIQQNNGTPGREFTIRLRGQNSLENGNVPLFIVDGIQFNSNTFTITGSGGLAMAPFGGAISPFSFLNPNDIESVEVLKDADATAIYGSRGANGVILITTKSGKSEKESLEFNIYHGITKAPQRVTFLDTEQYLAMRRKAFANDGKSPGLGDYDLNGTWDTTAYTNWQDELIGGTANVTEASLSISGGNKSTNFRLGSTFRNEGVIYPGDFLSKKGSLHFSLNHASENNKLKMTFSGAYINSENNLPSGRYNPTIFFRLAPNLPKPYNDDGTLNWAPNNEWVNPMADLLQTSDEKSKNLISNLLLSYRIIGGLELKGSFGYNTTNFNQNNLTPFKSYNPLRVNNAANLRVNEILDNNLRAWVFEPQLSYKVNLLGGTFDVLLGSTLQSTEKDYIALNAKGFSSDALIENFAAGTNITTLGRSKTQYRYSAIYSRLGYSFKEKYVVNMTARRDGSSRFGPENKFGNFGAVGAAWIFSNEKYIKDKMSFISLGKIRASYGTTGNDQLTDYQYLDTYTSNINYYQGISSLVPTQLTNPFYGWERVDKQEFALELGVLQNKVLLNASYYKNRTKNQLVQYGLPSVAGFTNVRANLPAVLENSGIEIDIQTINIERKAFSWSTAINITFPKNELISYPNIEASSYASIYEVGRPLSLLRAFHFTRIDQNTGLYDFEDVNKDGSITSAFDNKFVFRGQKFYGGLQNSLRYKSLELDFLFQFTKQNGRAYLKSPVPSGFFNSANGNQPSTSLNSALELPYSQSSIPILLSSNMFYSSDGSLTDASYIRLKNVAISWAVPLGSRVEKTLKSLRIYFQGQNLLTMTNYKGVDPEAPSDGLGIPSLSISTFGLKALF